MSFDSRHGLCTAPLAEHDIRICVATEDYLCIFRNPSLVCVCYSKGWKASVRKRELSYQ